MRPVEHHARPYQTGTHHAAFEAMAEKLLGAGPVLLARADMFSTMLYGRMSSGFVTRAAGRFVCLTPIDC